MKYGGKVNNKVLVLGGSGMLGHVVIKIFEKIKALQLFNIVRKNKVNKNSIICDASKIDDLEKIINEIRPNFIINCIGILKEESKNDYPKAIYLNSFLPNWLLSHCALNNIKFIHISTDCVFNGIVGNYSETSIPNANDNYGKSKALGEFDSSKNLCIRTSIIGPEINSNGKGLLSWVLNSKGDIKGYDKVYWSGVTTLELSRAIYYSIYNDINGMWNLTNKLPIKIFDLKKVRLIKETEKKTNLSLLSNKKINYNVPTYETMITEMKQFCIENRNLYNYEL